MADRSWVLGSAARAQRVPAALAVALYLVPDLRPHGLTTGQLFVVCIAMAMMGLGFLSECWLRGRLLFDCDLAREALARSVDLDSPRRVRDWLGVLCLYVFMLLLVAPWGLRAGGLWLGMLLGGTLLAEPGPPTFWAATIAALVMTVIFAMTGRPIWPSTSAGQRLRYHAVGFVLAVGGLGTAVVLLDGVTLQPSTPLQQVLSLAVLALLLTPAQADFPSARSSLVVQLVLVAPVVWLLSWLSRWLASPLAVAGVADLMLTALIVAVFTIPGRWMQRRLWRRPLPDLTPLEHRMFGPIP